MLPLQRPVLDSLRHIRGLALAFPVVGFVVGPVAQGQACLAVAFEGQDVGANALEVGFFFQVAVPCLTLARVDCPIWRSLADSRSSRLCIRMVKRGTWQPIREGLKN